MTYASIYGKCYMFRPSRGPLTGIGVTPVLCLKLKILKVLTCDTVLCYIVLLLLFRIATPGSELKVPPLR